jgi:EAL domain-containing protein (putative c-di-GMP-specific phosphodiesterase class I)
MNPAPRFNLASEHLNAPSRHRTDSSAVAVWMLVAIGQQYTDAQISVIHPTPFGVGRKPGSSLQLNAKTVSSHHADLDVVDGELLLIDRGSTNGTYVNGQRVVEQIVLNEEDLVQFADLAFRVRRTDQATNSRTVAEDVCDQALALVQFDRMMENRLVTPFFQPIIDFTDESIIGYEVLARSRLFGLETSAAMFGAASRLNMEVELSHMLRWEGVREGLSLPRPSTLYLNTHPRELDSPDLVSTMKAVKQLGGDMPIVLEIHEAAVTDPSGIQSLTQQIRDLDIKIAYDDFGAGQTRLVELGGSPPDILKFDMALIRNIDKATPDRRRMLQSLVNIVRDLGVQPLAEGIENEGEAEVCKEMGFETAQGYYFGKPAPPAKYRMI